MGLAAIVSALLRRALPWDVALPVASLIVIFAAIAIGQGAAALTLDLLVHPTAAKAGLLAAGLTLTLFAVQRGAPGPRGPGLGGLATALAYVPAAVAAGIAVIQERSLAAVASWSFLGTDLSQHVIGLRRVQEAGHLSYDGGGYPSGFHMLVALLRPTSANADELLVHDLQMVAGMTWLSLALLLAAGASFTIRVGAPRWSPRVVGLVAAVGGAGALVLNVVVDTFVQMGAAPTLLAATVLWAVPACAVLRPGDLTALLSVSAVSVALLAHLWQAVMPVPLLAAGAVALLGRNRLSIRALVLRLGWTVPLTFVLCALIALPPFLGIMGAGGTSLAGIPGELPHEPWSLLVLGTLGLVCGIAFRLPGTLPVAATAGGLVLCALVLGVGAGSAWTLTQYYPMKVLWFLALVLSPYALLMLSALTLSCCRSAGALINRLGRASAVARVCAGAAASAAVFAYALPPVVAAPSSTLASVEGLWNPDAADPGLEQLRIAALVDQHPEVTVVPVAVGRSVVFDQYTSYVVSKLMSFSTGQPQTHGRPHAVCHDVNTAAEGRPALVVTKLEREHLQPFMVSGGCTHIPVIQVPGGIADVAILRVSASAR